ncbi:hypothetical protein [Sphingomonas sp.]|uniref:hypothetical protein n=1 Tax=Sphingomonas sp. TaxID=28214 RepID=UPI0035C803D5
MTSNSLPPFSRFRFAREGSIHANGKLPQGWSNENADDVTVEAIDLGPDGPSITVTLAFNTTNAAPFVSVVLADYVPVQADDVFALRMDMEMVRQSGVSAAFLILREWISGGTYVGQATRSVPLDRGTVPVAAARMAGGESRLIQPVLSVRRAEGSAGAVTVRLRRLALASIHDHPAWLTDAR